MSQQAEWEQGGNTDEGKSASGKDRFVDQALEAQSSTHSSSISDLEEEHKVNENPQKRISELEEKVNNQQKIISDLEEEVHELNENQQKRISKLEEEVNKVNGNQQKRISDLEEKVNEAERKVNLWLYNLHEKEGENLKERVIAICRTVAPEAADKFLLHIDTVQRVGKTSKDKDRPVIIRFIARSTKELLLKSYKGSEYHCSSSLKFGEDLTAKEKETRKERWPIIEEARKEGKKACFAGDKVIIDGKEIDCN